VLAVAAVLALATPAWAQDDYQPVVGGGSFNAAPILEPGRYRDTLLPSEYLYYGFRLGPGQRLIATANADMPLEDFRALVVSDITGNLHSPTRTQFTPTPEYDTRDSFRVEGEPPLELTGPYVSDEEDTNTRGPWFGPGVYYLTFYAIYVGADEPPRAEIPFHFEVTVEGDAEPTPTPSPSPSPSPSPTPSPAPTVSENGGAGAGAAVGFGVGGLLIGAAGGLVLRRRRG
jgi:hypothetical protein